MIGAKRLKSIADVLEEVDVLNDTHFFDQFYEKKSKKFLKNVVENQNTIDISLLRKSRRSLNCTPKNNESDHGDPGKPPLRWEEERIDHQEKADTKCWCSKN